MRPSTTCKVPANWPRSCTSRRTPPCLSCCRPRSCNRSTDGLKTARCGEPNGLFEDSNVNYSFDFGAVWAFRWIFAKSIVITLEISLLAIVFGTVLGVLMGAARAIDKRGLLLTPIWAFCTAFVYLQLAIPALVLLVWMYYCLPLLGINISSYWTAILALGINLSPFAAEIFRSSLRNMPRGEMQAARAMGYTSVQTFLYFSLPFRPQLDPAAHGPVLHDAENVVAGLGDWCVRDHQHRPGSHQPDLQAAGGLHRGGPVLRAGGDPVRGYGQAL